MHIVYIYMCVSSIYPFVLVKPATSHLLFHFDLGFFPITFPAILLTSSSQDLRAGICSIPNPLVPHPFPQMVVGLGHPIFTSHGLEDPKELPHVNLVFIGPSGSGKSTMLGHLIAESDAIDAWRVSDPFYHPTTWPVTTKVGNKRVWQFYWKKCGFIYNFGDGGRRWREIVSIGGHSTKKMWL